MLFCPLLYISSCFVRATLLMPSTMPGLPPSKFSTYELDVHLDVTNVLGQLSPRTLNGDSSGLDGNGDTLGNDQRLDGRDVLHFELCCTMSKLEFEM